MTQREKIVDKVLTLCNYRNHEMRNSIDYLIKLYQVGLLTKKEFLSKLELLEKGISEQFSK